jgi:hypothetical protein
MAVNSERSMLADFHQGVVDNTYIHLVPNRGNVENPPYDRMTWPIYGQAEKHVDPPFIEAHLARSVLPREARNGDQDPSGDLRY